MEATQTASHLDGSHPADGDPQDARHPDAHPPTFESVWAILDRVSKKQEEYAQGMIELRKSQKETDRIVKETALQMKETGRRIDDYNKRFGDFTRRFGDVAEYLLAPSLLEKFRELGLDFHNAAHKVVFDDQVNDLAFEIDVFLQNGDKAMLCEMKATLTTEDVKEHIERLDKMREYADLHGDKRAFLGAVAGVVVTTNVKKYALGRGLYVIEPSGENFNITPPNGKPKEW